MVNITHINPPPDFPSAWLVVKSIGQINGPVLAQVLFLGEPSAYRSETFVGDPLLHDLPWISEFNFDLINTTELYTLKIYPQSFAAELGAPEFEMIK
jgi:hypothetical protein